MSQIIEQQFAQALLNQTAAASIFSPRTGEIAIIKEISIVNVSAAAATITLYFCNYGTDYNDSTTIYPGKAYSMGAGEAEKLGVYMPMNNPSGNFAYAKSVASSFTVTLWGAIIK